MYIDEISFCTFYINMYSILVKQVMRIKNLAMNEQVDHERRTISTYDLLKYVHHNPHICYQRDRLASE